MTPDEITTTLRDFARSRKSGCRACPEYNSCGKIGCRMAEEAANLIEMQRREIETLDAVCDGLLAANKKTLAMADGIRDVAARFAKTEGRENG